MQTRVLAHAHDLARAFLAGLDERPVGVRLDLQALHRQLGRPLSDGPIDPVQVIDDLARDVEGGLLGSASGRFFGWVIGGTLPVAIAADWLAAAWDQNAAAYALSPAASVAEEVCGAWLKDLLGLPATASFALVTGCQMAHITALAAARHKLLDDRGIDVERQGLAGAPALRVLVGTQVHESILRAVRLLGIGTDAIELLPWTVEHSLDVSATARALMADTRPTILCLQAGELNTGASDPFMACCAVAHRAGAWVHVDGAFGMWAAASPRLRAQVAGIDHADSWALDGHKWLNLPYDIGFAFTAHPDAHRAAFEQQTRYGMLVDGSRRQIDWTPEWSRRARGFVVYAALRALGRDGLATMIQTSCEMATRLVADLARIDDVEVLVPPRLNQALIRCRASNGEHDRRTEAVMTAVRESGEAWFGGVIWQGQRAMRISVCNWRTGAGDIARAVAAIRQAMANIP